MCPHELLIVFVVSGVLGDGARMSGVIDLGGGSTQITFTPQDEVRN